MTTVADYLAQISRRRFSLVGWLLLAWIALVIIDIMFGIAKYEWVGLPVFIAFVAAFGYFIFFAPPRCPACRAAIHSCWWRSFYPYPQWIPRWFQRFFPRRTHCVSCGLAFATPLAQISGRAL